MTDMNIEYAEPYIVTLEDEDGKQHEFEIVGDIDYNENRYLAASPYYSDPAQALKEEPVMLIFRVGEPDEEGLDTFDIVDDDEEYFEVGGVFTEIFEKMMEEES